MMKKWKNILLAVVFSVSAFALVAASQNVPKPEKKQIEMRDLHGVTSLATNIFLLRHYSGKKMSPEICEQALHLYLRNLDPTKSFFTQQDVDQFFTGKANLSKQFVKGDLTLAFQIFQLFRTRYAEYYAFVEDLLAKETAEALLTTDGTIQMDRKDAAWEKDPAALKVYWRKKVINELLVQHLADRAMKKETEEIRKKIADGDKKAEKDLPVLPTTTPEQRVLKRINQVRRLYAEMEQIEVAELFINAFAGVLDPHTSYMSPVTDEDFNIDMSLKLTGIGATLTIDEGYTKVVNIVPGSPAEKDGRLQEGDRIIAVAQGNKEPEDIVDMPLSKVVRKIRGPVGTVVTLTVIHAKNGAYGVPVTIQLTRAEVIVKDREAKSEIRKVKAADGTERKLGVISLPSFYFDYDAMRSGKRDYKCASRDVEKLLIDLKKQGVDGIVMDLRSNGGGSLPDCAALTGLFVKEGPVVQVRSKSSLDTCDDRDGGKVVYDGPLVVLVNRLSASASEIFAGAIRDYGRGIVVGDSKTHGKGTVQTVFSMNNMIRYVIGKQMNAGSLKLTEAKFYRVNGESTQLKGVVPDVILPSFFDAMDMGEDKLDYPLPWDKIAPVDYKTENPGLNVIDVFLPRLRKASETRIGASSEFQALLKDIERFEKISKAKTLSLNLETRWQKYLEEKKITEEQSVLFKLDNDDDDKGKDKKSKDLYLKETLNILNDWIDAIKQVQQQ